MIRTIALVQVLSLLVSAKPLPAADKYGIADPTTAPTEEGYNPPSQSYPPPSPSSSASGDSERRAEPRQISITPRSLRAHLLQRDDDDADMGVFAGSMVALVKSEQKSVQRKYAKAVRYLQGVKPGHVDLGFNSTMTLQSANGSSTLASGSSTSTVSFVSSTGSTAIEVSSTSNATVEQVTSSTTSTASTVSTLSTVSTISSGSDSRSTSTTSPAATPSATSRPTGLLGSELSKLEQRGNAIVELTDYISGGMDVLYYGGIKIGNPAQDMTVDFDTGSADLWVPVDCRDCTSAQFNAARSVTYQDTGDDFSIEYGTGSVSGVLARDSVWMAGSAVDGQYFGAVDEESEDFDGNPNAGVMGMAFSSISASGKPTFFENLISGHAVPAPLFGFHLTRRQPTGSTLCIGCMDSSKFNGGISWVPVISKTYWSVTMSGMAAMGKGNALSKSLVAAIDTGTTLIYVPDVVASDFYAQIPGASSAASQFGQGFYQFPCNSPLAMTLNFNSQSFKLNTRDFNLGRTGGGSNLCVGGILGMGSDFPNNLAIIGDEFLKSWYSIYDYSNGARVGFAASINN